MTKVINNELKMEVILPLIFDYLDIPFELVKVSKLINIRAKKCLLTISVNHKFSQKKAFNDMLFTIYKFKYVKLGNNKALTHLDMYLLGKNLKVLDMAATDSRYTEPVITKVTSIESYQYTPNIIKLSLEFCNSRILPYLSNLESLSAVSSYICDDDLKYIPKIKKLIIRENDVITDNGLKYIPNIRELDLGRNRKITDTGLQYIPNIIILLMTTNKNVTREGTQYLKHAKKIFTNRFYITDGEYHSMGTLF